MSPKPVDPFRSMRSLRRTGMAVAIALVGIVGGWAVTTEIAGAVIATGKVIAAGNTKKVQHPTGGVVGRIFARDGQRVRAGEVLIRLDGTVARTNRDIVIKRLTELLARRARLAAERDGIDAVRFPAELLMQPERSEAAAVREGERRLFASRRAARNGKIQQLGQRKIQIELSIGGIEIQSKAKADEVKLIARELTGARELWRQGLMPVSKLTTLEREMTRVKGEHGQLLASVAQARAAVAETELQLVQIDQDLASEVGRELAEVNGQIAELRERLIAAEDQLARIDVRAPQAGVVHQSVVHTVGGVIGAGETLMEIVPRDDRFVVEARVEPQDIDQIHTSQAAVLRFSAFNQRTTPEVSGTVEVVAANTTVDQASRRSHYAVRIAVAESELARLGEVSLVSGMPVEAFIRTHERNVLSYLLKPLTDQLQRAFRDS